jgi:hypothetical protein
MDANLISTCEVCGSQELEKVLDLGLHPLCDDLMPIGSATLCSEYPIQVLFCDKCKTAHQRYQVPKQRLFNKDYHYRARFTSDVLDGMDELVKSVEDNLCIDLSNKFVVDIGCNDGSLLDIFQFKGCKTVGVEPTGAAIDAIANKHHIYNDYFTKDLAKDIVQKFGHPDLITFTNVFAHIERLNDLLEAIKILASDETIIIIENHYLGSIIKKNQFDTFYHEHPRTYSYNSFIHIAQSLGFCIDLLEFPARYGGNIRVGLTKSKNNHPTQYNRLSQSILETELSFKMDLLKMQLKIDKWQKTTSSLIDSLVNKYGPIAAKSFPGRAAILFKMLNLDSNSIRAIYEKPGSMKIGNYAAGTNIPILSDDQMSLEIADTPVILNLAWHIPKEIEVYLRHNGFKGEIINIFNPDGHELNKAY